MCAYAYTCAHTHTHEPLNIHTTTDKWPSSLQKPLVHIINPVLLGTLIHDRLSVLQSLLHFPFTITLEVMPLTHFTDEETEV